MSEARVRRLKWPQKLSAWPLRQIRGLAALFGDDLDDEKNTDEEGRDLRQISPWTIRRLIELEELGHTTDEGEGLLSRHDSRWMRLFQHTHEAERFPRTDKVQVRGRETSKAIPHLGYSVASRHGQHQSDHEPGCAKQISGAQRCRAQPRRSLSRRLAGTRPHVAPVQARSTGKVWGKAFAMLLARPARPTR